LTNLPAPMHSAAMPAVDPFLRADWSILLAACSSITDQEKGARLRSLLQGSINWKSLFALADRHGVEPLLYQALVRVEDAVPKPEIQALRQTYQDNVYKSLLLSRELIRILDHLLAANIEVMPYKGLALAEALYGDVALRRVGDIDLLIHSKDLSRIRRVVGDLGYSPHVIFSEAEEQAYLKSGYECAFDSTIGANLLEVQWAIQPRFYAVDFDMDGIFERAVTISVAGRAMKTPSPADLMLILSAHAAKHVWGRLIWLCDVARLLESPDLDWAWMRHQAESLGIARIVGITMMLANKLLHVPTPAAAMKSFPQDSAMPPLIDEIQASLSSETNYNVESLAYFHLMLSLRERPADRLRFLTRLALTPGPSEWQAVRLPRPLFPLYRLVRLTRLAARAVSA
jgi:hypothetical protein